MAFLLDIIGDIKNCLDNCEMAEVVLKNLKEDKEYFILGHGINITVSSRNHSVELPNCKIYTVRVKNGRCSDNTSSPFPIPKGRCIRVLVVSFLFLIFFFYTQ